MKSRSIKGWLCACVVAAVLSLPGMAMAQTLAYTNTGANLRAGPDVGYPLVAYVPYQASVQVYGCTNDWSWCDVAAGYSRGWMSAAYLEYYDDGGEPRLVNAYGMQIGLPIIGFVFGSYWDTWYRNRSWYSRRHRWEGYRPPPRPPIRPPAHRLPFNQPPSSGRPPQNNPQQPGRPSMNNQPQQSGRPSMNNQPQQSGRPSMNNRPQPSGEPSMGSQPGHPSQQQQPRQGNNRPQPPARPPANMPQGHPAQHAQPEKSQGGGNKKNPPPQQAHGKPKEEH